MADLRGWRGVRADQACTDAAFEAGINFLDTANVYGRGAAESAWGEILADRPRDSYGLDRPYRGHRRLRKAFASVVATEILSEHAVGTNLPAASTHPTGTACRC